MKGYLATIFCIACSFRLYAQAPVIQLEEFSTGYTAPVDIQHCGDSRLFIVQQNGYIYICDSAGNKNTTPFLDIHTKINTLSEQGLLGLAFDPDYSSNRTFYIYYTKKGGQWDLTIARYKTDSLDENLADTASAEILMSIPHPTNNNHNGGCMQFGPDNYLYIGTGDGGSAGDPDTNAQNLEKYLGKLLRIDVSQDSGYSIPGDNPFVNNSDAYPEIWAFGLRNPWRFCFDYFTHDLWIADVGQNTWEEIDFIAYPDTGGQNYGWDCYEGTHDYEPNNCDANDILTWPIYEYQHTGSDCSVTGGYVYRGSRFANLFGRYIYTDYCTGKFRAIEPDGAGGWTVYQAGDLGNFNFSGFGQNIDNELYVAGVSDGKIYHVVDTSCTPVAAIIERITSSVSCLGVTLHAVSGENLSYQWLLDGNLINGATTTTWTPTQTGEYSLKVTNDEGCSNSSLSIKVGDYTIPSITNLDDFYCTYYPAVSLTGDPAGGIFSIDGVENSVFDPATLTIGTHAVVYTFTNDYGCVASDSMSVVVDECLGSNYLWEEIGVNVFPNPADGFLSVVLKDTNEKISEINIYSSDGRLAWVGNAAELEGNFSYLHLNTSDLFNGVYVLEIVKQEEVITLKFVISH